MNRVNCYPYNMFIIISTVPKTNYLNCDTVQVTTEETPLCITILGRKFASIINYTDNILKKRDGGRGRKDTQDITCKKNTQDKVMPTRTSFDRGPLAAH